MSIRNLVGRIINGASRPFGVKICRLNSDVSMLKAMEHIRRRGYCPSSIIDVGASNGKWSLMAHGVFPDAHFLLFEPLPQNRAAIYKLLRKHRNWHYSEKAAGDKAGIVSINVSEDLDGSAVVFDEQASNRVRQFEMVRVDSVCEALALPAPYLVKLDTHGFEIPILDGMENIWSRIAFLIIEAYNFKLHAECLRFFELASFLETKGFLPTDIADVHHRPGDFLFWQMDIVFGRKEQKEFQRCTYKV